MKLLNLFKKEFPGAVIHINHPIAHKIRTGKELHAEGYTYNVVVYRCVDSIIKALKPIKVQIKQGDKILEDTNAAVAAVEKIMRKPNPAQYRGSFLTEAFVNRLVIGEMFLVTADDNDRTPQEIWNLDPLEMHVLPGKGLPRAYEHKVSGKTVRWDVDQIDGNSAVFYWKGHNPLNKWRGLSPLHAASLASDTNNAGLRWNFSLLKKGARSSGLVKFKGVPGEDVLKRLRTFFKEQIQGENNAGEVPILTGEADYQELGKSPKDMDYIKTVDKTTAFIAMGYGVPLPLVLNEASTFNNYREAKEVFYTDTVIPLYGEFLDSFGGWLLPKFGLKDAHFVMDKDSITALETVRERRNERNTKLVAGGIISPDEARQELGYEPRGGLADELFMPASSIPIEENTNLPEDEKSLTLLLEKQGYSQDEIETALKDL